MSSFGPEGMICGRGHPVSGFFVAMTWTAWTRFRRDVAVLAVRELTAVLAQAAASAWPGETRWLRFPRPTVATPPRIRAVTLRACAPRTPAMQEHNAAGAAAVGLIANVLKGYRIEGDDMIDAVRMLRAALHGFVALEAAGGFGLPQSVDGTFTRLVDSLHIAWSTWSTETGRG